MTTGDTEKMKTDSVFLFPHSRLPLAAKDEILSSFQTLIVCRPWYMEAAGDAEDDHGRTRIIYPPEDLKPPKDFMKLLAEYRVWMSQNRGYTPPPVGAGEDATWEIRHILRHTGKDVSAQVEEQALKWHLILHLERELEESRTSADEMLLQVKAEKSPLAEALGEATVPNGFFDDLALSDSPSSIEERHLKQVLGAWFGLFGRVVPQDGILLTMTPDVFNYAAELFETGHLEPAMEERSSSFRKIKLPAASIDSPLEKDPLRAGLSGKTLILMNEWMADKEN
jgi:hypothetical protein